MSSNYEFGISGELYDNWSKHFGPNSHVLFPIDIGQEATFKLIDEDLTNALKTLIPKGNDIFMSHESMEYQKGYNHGYNDAEKGIKRPRGYTAPVNLTNETEIYPKNPYKTEEKTNYNDSRMNAEQIPKFHCPNCKIELVRYDMKFGMIFEHYSGYETGCQNEGKYIYIKKKLYKSE
jgi:hypothetical protein